MDTRLASVYEIFGRISHYSTCSTQCTPSTSCVCHPSVALLCVWIGRPSLEREVQWDFRVDSSSFGAYRDVVHSPFEWLFHRCHCYCRDLVFVRDVVWWWLFLSWWCLRFGLGQCEADDWKYFFNCFQYHKLVGCVCMLDYWFSSSDEICSDKYNYSRFKLLG